MEKKPTKRMSRKTRRILISALIGLLLAVFLFSGYKLYTIAHAYRAARHSYDTLSGSVVTNTESSLLASPCGGMLPRYADEQISPSTLPQSML